MATMDKCFCVRPIDYFDRFYILINLYFRVNVTPAVIVPWLLNVTWTSAFIDTWKTFYNTAQRLLAYGRAGFYNITILPSLPTYTDLYMSGTCNISNGTSSTSTTVTTTIITTTKKKQSKTYKLT